MTVWLVWYTSYAAPYEPGIAVVCASEDAARRWIEAQPIVMVNTGGIYSDRPHIAIGDDYASVFVPLGGKPVDKASAFGIEAREVFE